MKFITGLVFFLQCLVSVAQSTDCKLQESSLIENLKVVDSDDLQCIAKNSDNKYTLVFIYAVWCAPCNKHLIDAIDLSNRYDISLYVLIADGENAKALKEGYTRLMKIDSNMKTLTLKDELYGKRAKQRITTFINEITPPNNEIIPDLSKYILYDKMGKIVAMTSYKDYVNEDWKDEKKIVIEKKLLPILNGIQNSTLQ